MDSAVNPQNDDLYMRSRISDDNHAVKTGSSMQHLIPSDACIMYHAS
jgi:hypothetical protein